MERRPKLLRREMMERSAPSWSNDMARTASLVLLFGSLNLMAQTSTEILDRALMRQTICGPIGVEARMLDTSHDGLAQLHQGVGFTLHNLKSTPIVLERYTLNFHGETATSGAPFEAEIRVPVNAGQEAPFASLTTVPNPVSYVEINLVRYADGSSWQPKEGEVCKIVPNPLINQATGNP
jgi:hypothetical protein